MCPSATAFCGDSLRHDSYKNATSHTFRSLHKLNRDETFSILTTLHRYSYLQIFLSKSQPSGLWRSRQEIIMLFVKEKKAVMASKCNSSLFKNSTCLFFHKQITAIEVIVRLYETWKLYFYCSCIKLKPVCQAHRITKPRNSNYSRHRQNGYNKQNGIVSTGNLLQQC